MSARSVHFAVTAGQARQLLAAKSDRKLMGLIEAIEEAWEQLFVRAASMAGGVVSVSGSGVYGLFRCTFSPVPKYMLAMLKDLSPSLAIKWRWKLPCPTMPCRRVNSP
jgi:hypothetical protein